MDNIEAKQLTKNKSNLLPYEEVENTLKSESLRKAKDLNRVIEKMTLNKKF